MKEHLDDFVQAFDRSSTQESNVQISYPDVVAATLRLQLHITYRFPSATEVALFGERLRIISIDKTGTPVEKG